MAERRLQEFTYRMRLTGCNYIIVRFMFLEYSPHSPNVIFRMSPVASRIKSAQSQFFDGAELYFRRMRSNFPGDEFKSAARPLMIVKNSNRRMQAVSLTVISCKLTPGHLRYAIGRVGMTRSQFV